MTFSIAASLLLPAFLFASAASNPATKSKSSATTHSTAKKTTSRATGKRRYSARRKPAGPAYQTHPTADRYKEIQQSLADKGYFKGEVNGTWGDDSTDALKRFQSDHKLADDGKINSLSLIELGLGPKHDIGTLHPTDPQEGATPELPKVTEEPAPSPADSQ
jgi:peptidoglycan hydrolase-like protein with peptidoglycan-binding domain